MKTTFAILAFVALFARGAALPPLPASAFADTEVATNVSFSAGDALTRAFELSLELDATAENCLEVAFGTDANADGALDRDECELSVGWRCGSWFYADEVAGTADAVSRPPGRRTLLWRLALGPRRTPRDAGLSAVDAGDVFGPAASAGMFNPAWDMVRVVARGRDMTSESLAIGLSALGFSLRVR